MRLNDRCLLIRTYLLTPTASVVHPTPTVRYRQAAGAHWCHKIAIRLYIYFQINQPTRCISLSDLLLVVQIQLNMFRASSCPSSGGTTAVAASGLPLERGDSSVVGRGRPDHDQQYCYHQAPTVNLRLLLQFL